MWCWRHDQQTAALGTQAGAKREKEQAKVSKKRCIWNQGCANKDNYMALRFWLFFGLSCWPLDDDDGVVNVDVVDVDVGCFCWWCGEDRDRLSFPGRRASVVWCDVSKSKQKEVLLKSGAVLIKIIIWPCGFGSFFGCLTGLQMMRAQMWMLVLMLMLLIHLVRESRKQ